EPRPLILDTNKDEGTLFTAPIFGKEVPDEPAYRAALGMRFAPSQVDAIVAHYPIASFPSPTHALAEVSGDAFFVCPTRFTARTLADKGAAVYRYSFEQELEQPFTPDLGVFHASELPFVFGNDTFPLGKMGAGAALSDWMGGYWTGFAKHADP